MAKRRRPRKPSYQKDGTKRHIKVGVDKIASSSKNFSSKGAGPIEDYAEKVNEDPKILWKGLPPETPQVISARAEQRKGKKTIVILGTSPDSCGLAPWNEDGIDEIWAVNDAHHLPFMHMEKITRWFQLHQPWRFQRPTPRYGIAHYEWLKKEHPFPIYMQREFDEIPNSIKFPLYEIAKEFLYSDEHEQWLLGRGQGFQRKYFACTFSYMCGLAMLENKDNLENLRIELYGTELAQQTEYYMQRPNTEFWAGLAVGRGVQLYVPQITRILQGVFYAYRYPSVQDTMMENAQKKEEGKWKEEMFEPDPDIHIDEDNVGEWPESAMPRITPLEFGGIFDGIDLPSQMVRSYDGNPAEYPLGNVVDEGVKIMSVEIPPLDPKHHLVNLTGEDE